MTNNITNFTTSIPFSFTDPESLTFSITENVSLMVAIITPSIQVPAIGKGVQYKSR